MRSVSIRSRLPSIASAPFDDGKVVGYGILLLFACIAGCGEAPKSKAPASPATVKTPAAAKIEIVDASRLPVVDSPAPPLDEGRLELSLPADWRRAPRSKDYLIKVQRSRQANFPVLIVTVEPAEDLPDITRENAVEFAAQIQAKLDAELGPQGLALAEPVRPVAIGDLTAIEYVRKAKSTAGSIERLFIVTAARGRRYVVELRTLQGNLAEFRPWARAVAASMKFSAGTPGDSPEAQTH